MVIETAITTLATACLKALKLAARLERTSREVKAKCQELAERVKTLLEILPRYSSAAANDSGTAATLGRLEDALNGACRAADSCDRHIHGGFVGWSFALLSDLDRQDLSRLVDAEEKIDRCMRDLRLAVGALAVAAGSPVGVRQQQQLPTTTTIHNHYNNILRVDNMRVDNINMYAPPPPAAWASPHRSSDSRKASASAKTTTHAPPAASASHHRSSDSRKASATAKTTTHAPPAASASHHRSSDSRKASASAKTTTHAPAASASHHRSSDTRKASAKTSSHAPAVAASTSHHRSSDSRGERKKSKTRREGK